MSEEYLNEVEKRMIAKREIDPLNNNKEAGLKKIENYYLPIIPLIDDFLQKNENVKILDVGGGVGDNYCNIMYWYPRGAREKVEYSIIDTIENCNRGEALNLLGNINFIPFNFNEEDRIRENNGILEKYDIVILCETLQYAKEYKKLLEIVCKYNPKYIYITRTILNDSISTFYTIEKTCTVSKKYKVPVLVINSNEISNIMSKLGYGLSLDLYLNDYAYNFKKFPKPYNEVEYRNLIYKNNKFLARRI